MLLSHRHLSLRLRMELTRLHALARSSSGTTLASTSNRHGASSLLARFSHRDGGTDPALPSPRRLPAALALELAQLAPLVRFNLAAN